MQEIDYPSSGIKIKDLLKEHSLRLLHHGDLDINHWTDLYEIIKPEIICSQGCSNPAKFILFEHDHYNNEFVTTSCGEHCPPSYFEFLDERNSA